MTDASLWTEASRDVEEEGMERLFVSAKVAVAEHWPFLAGAENETDFANRKGLIEDHLNRAVAQITGDDPVSFPLVRARLEESLDEDFTIHAQARMQRQVAQRKQAYGSITVDGIEFDWDYEYDPEHANTEGEDAVVVVVRLADTEEVVGSLGGITLESLQISDHGNVNISPEDEAYLRIEAQEVAAEYTGGQQRLLSSRKIAAMAKCKSCGHSWDSSKDLGAAKCPQCGSSDLERPSPFGRSKKSIRTQAEGVPEQLKESDPGEKDCTACDGNGTVPDDDGGIKDCEVCDGTGAAKDQEDGEKDEKKESSRKHGERNPITGVPGAEVEVNELGGRDVYLDGKYVGEIRRGLETTDLYGGVHVEWGFFDAQGKQHGEVSHGIASAYEGAKEYLKSLGGASKESSSRKVGYVAHRWIAEDDDATCMTCGAIESLIEEAEQNGPMISCPAPSQYTAEGYYEASRKQARKVFESLSPEHQAKAREMGEDRFMAFVSSLTKQAKMTKTQIRDWLLAYAWLGTPEEREREVECILSQDGWKHLEAQGEQYDSMGWAPGASHDEAGHIEGYDFALSALYETHDAPHLPTCPAVTGRTGSKQRGRRPFVGVRDEHEGVSKQAEQRLCYCENQHCGEPHSLGACQNIATQACAYIGWICDPCAKYMPDEYLKGPLSSKTAATVTDNPYYQQGLKNGRDGVPPPAPGFGSTSKDRQAYMDGWRKGRDEEKKQASKTAGYVSHETLQVGDVVYPLYHSSGESEPATILREGEPGTDVTGLPIIRYWAKAEDGREGYVSFGSGGQVYKQGSMRKGAPFAGYEDFEDCRRKNSDKDSPDAYCGRIKYEVEGLFRQDVSDVRGTSDSRAGTTGAAVQPVRGVSSDSRSVSAAHARGQGAPQGPGERPDQGRPEDARRVRQAGVLASEDGRNRGSRQRVQGVRGDESPRAVDQPHLGSQGHGGHRHEQGVVPQGSGRSGGVRSAVSELPTAVGLPEGGEAAAHLGGVRLSARDAEAARREIGRIKHQVEGLRHIESASLPAKVRALIEKVRQGLTLSEEELDKIDSFLMGMTASKIASVPAHWQADFDKFSEALKPWIIDFDDGTKGLSPDAPESLTRPYQQLLQVGYANGWVASRRQAQDNPYQSEDNPYSPTTQVPVQTEPLTTRPRQMPYSDVIESPDATVPDVNMDPPDVPEEIIS